MKTLNRPWSYYQRRLDAERRNEQTACWLKAMLAAVLALLLGLGAIKLGEMIGSIIGGV